MRSVAEGGQHICRDAAEAAIEWVGDDPLNAFVTFDVAAIRREADAIDARLNQGELLPLAGSTVALKDNLCVNGSRTTCGSRMLADWIPPYDATVVARLRSAGAVLFGKTNMDEFAMGSSTESSAFGPTLNPRHRERVPGGSSGGSAAVVGAGWSPMALGSDTGGSVRQPAAYCGIYAVKPSYGRISRFGLVAFASSLDQVGPMGATVADCARLYDVIAGPDPRDVTTVSRPPDSAADAVASGRAHGATGLRIGVVQSALDIADGPVAESVRVGARALASEGAELVDVDLTHMDLGLAAYYLIAAAEASSNLARFDGTRFGTRAPGHGADTLHQAYARTRSAFGPEAVRRIVLGTYALSEGYAQEAYVRASRARTAIVRAFDGAFEGTNGKRVDLLLLPTAPTPAFRLGEREGDPLAMYAADVFTVLASLAGLPASSSPVDEVGGLPVGLQLIAPRYGETTMFRAMAALEHARES